MPLRWVTFSKYTACEHSPTARDFRSSTDPPCAHIITTYDSNGTVVKQSRVRNNPMLIRSNCEQCDGSHKAVVESTGASYCLADLLRITTWNSRSHTQLDSRRSQPPKCSSFSNCRVAPFLVATNNRSPLTHHYVRLTGHSVMVLDGRVGFTCRRHERFMTHRDAPPLGAPQPHRCPNSPQVQSDTRRVR